METDVDHVHKLLDEGYQTMPQPLDTEKCVVSNSRPGPKFNESVQAEVLCAKECPSVASTLPSNPSSITQFVDSVPKPRPRNAFLCVLLFTRDIPTVRSCDIFL